MLQATDHKTIVAELFALYTRYGNEEYIGEPVSQLEHMSQAAALAESEGYDDEVILAAFFHDLGHLCASAGQVDSMGGFGNVDHEKLGADYLRAKGFSERLAVLVKSHVLAKRYLTYKFPDYYAQLSPASKATLVFQGGLMTAEEAAQFESNPDAELIIRLRYWDDKAKEIDVPVNNIKKLENMALLHLMKQHNASTRD
jgi:phosphonate degradation associated HDIG domain protein